ncbi:YciI family protein [Pseudonocardia sp. CA-107938]|uniref:YciI family protein n=1 Tax=Pseudonocardia sp. CA-107938 TaxID=3240021 RepID=UPI003D8DF31B
MKYMLLIAARDPQQYADEAFVGREMQAYIDFEKAVAEAGVKLAGEALQGVETASTVAVAESGERVVTDGPFAETREGLGGFYLLDVPDLDAALDWAARCPGSQFGGKIEVRPIQSYDY